MGGVRRLRFVTVLSLLAGLACLVQAGLRGELSVHLVVVVPVVSGTGPWALAGFLLLFVAIGTWWWGRVRAARASWGTQAHSARPRGARDAGEHAGPASRRGEASEPGSEHPGARSGGILLLGPIPIVWGSDRSGLWQAALLGLVLTLIALGLYLWAR